MCRQDGNGEITVEEIGKMVAHLDVSLVSGKQAEKVVDEVLTEVQEEAGIDGKLQPITFEEFVDLMCMDKTQARAFFQSIKRGAVRTITSLGVDFHGTKSVEVQQWNWQEQPTSASSVYANRSGVGLRRALTSNFTAKSPKSATSSVLLVGAPEAGREPPPRAEVASDAREWASFRPDKRSESGSPKRISSKAENSEREEQLPPDDSEDFPRSGGESPKSARRKEPDGESPRSPKTSGASPRSPRSRKSTGGESPHSRKSTGGNSPKSSSAADAKEAKVVRRSTRKKTAEKDMSEKSK